MKVTELIKSPSFKVGAGIALMIFGGVEAIKATPKAVRIIEETREKERMEKLGAVKTIKIAGKYYIPFVLMEIGGIIAILSGYSDSIKNTAAAVAMCESISTAYRDYRESAKEVVGEEKERDISNRAAQKTVDRQVYELDAIERFSDGEVIFLDEMTGKLLKGDRETVRAAINDFNALILSDGWASYNEFLDRLGSGVEHCKAGELIRFNNMVDISLSDACVTRTGMPAILIRIYTQPERL